MKLSALLTTLAVLLTVGSVPLVSGDGEESLKPRSASPAPAEAPAVAPSEAPAPALPSTSDGVPAVAAFA